MSSKKSLDRKNPCSVPGMQCFQSGCGKICAHPATQTFQLLFSLCCFVTCSESCITTMTDPLYVMISQAFMLMAGFITEDRTNSFSIFMQTASDFTLIGYLERKWNGETNTWDRSFHDLSTDDFSDCNIPILYKDGNYYLYNQDVVAEMVRGVRHVPYYAKLLNILTDKWNGMSDTWGLGHITTLHAHLIERNVTEEVARPRLSAIVSNVIHAFNECGGFTTFNQLLEEGVSNCGVYCEITRSDDLEMYVCVSEEAKKMGLTANNDDGSGTKLTDMITQLNQTCKVKENFSRGDYVRLKSVGRDGKVQTCTWKNEKGGFYEYKVRLTDGCYGEKDGLVCEVKHEDVECAYEANEKITEKLNAVEKDGGTSTMSFNDVNVQKEVEKDGGSSSSSSKKSTTTTTTTRSLICDDEKFAHATTFPIEGVGSSDNEMEKHPDIAFMENYLRKEGISTDADLDDLFENKDVELVDDDWYKLHPQYEWDEENGGPWKAITIPETPKKKQRALLKRLSGGKKKRSKKRPRHEWFDSGSIDKSNIVNTKRGRKPKSYM